MSRNAKRLLSYFMCLAMLLVAALPALPAYAEAKATDGAAVAADGALSAEAAVAADQAPVADADAAEKPANETPQEPGAEAAPIAEGGDEAAEAALEPEAAPEAEPELEPAAELVPLAWDAVAPELTVEVSWGVQISIAHPSLNDEGVQVFYTNDGTDPTDSSTREEVIPFTYPGAGTFWSISAGWGGPPLAYGVYRAVVVLDGQLSAVGQCAYNPAPPVTTFTSGVYKTLSEVSLAAPGGAAGTIYYTSGTADIDADGAPKPGEVAGIADPSDQSALYSAPISVAGADADTAFVVKAKFYVGGLASDTLIVWYTIDSSLPSLADVSDTNTQAEIDAKISDVIAAMSIDELISMTAGIGMNPGIAINPGVAGGTTAIPRLGIPSTLLSDGPAGVRMARNATVWMSPTGLASTWDVDAMEEVAARVAAEGRHYAVDIMLAPALNIQRNPLGGRDFEYYSEDPVIAGETAAAYTRALQAAGLGVSLKHYAANNQENFRSGGETVVSERALREIYLAGFERAVQEDPWTVMSSYNRVNSIYAASNEWLLTDMLREAFGFKGYVMTDWMGGNNGPQSMVAQNDMWQPMGAEAAINAWLQDPSASDAEKAQRLALVKRNVANILRVVIKTPVFNGDYATLDTVTIDQNSADFYTSVVNTASAPINQKTAAEGMVLLKNDGALPFSGVSNIALITSDVARVAATGAGGMFGIGGASATADLVIEGGGSAQVTWDNTVVKSLASVLTTAGYAVNSAVDADVVSSAVASAAVAASNNDIGIMIISRTSSEGADNARSSFDLSATEQTVLEAYGSAFKAEDKKFVVLINAGASINVQQINEYADAALVVYLPGSAGAEA
ncbi:MAG: glycoside hydrolase family 3 C-terminal domain-containing protein, partial [Clostridiales bacterium]|nr:glycoside hydrolase family 3 C-terminal domain-containing protein [Clostridiales bacterium]